MYHCLFSLNVCLILCFSLVIVGNLMFPMGWGADLKVGEVMIKADLFSAMHKIQFTKSVDTHK